MGGTLEPSKAIDVMKALIPSDMHESSRTRRASAGEAAMGDLTFTRIFRTARSTGLEASGNCDEKKRSVEG